MSERYQVESYADARGEWPALEFIHRLPEKQGAAIVRVLHLVAEFGLEVIRPYARHGTSGRNCGNCE